MKSDRVLEDIKSKIDIVDFISDYVQLKKSGQNWKGLCPFHTEKTPSFMVSPSKQIFHCFGCSSGGDVLSFLMKLERLSFQEALQTLARKAGISIHVTPQDKRNIEKDEQIRNALSVAADFFVQKLKISKNAADYISSRGITADSSRLFKLGYAPPGWSNLMKHLKTAGCSELIMKEAGLIVAGDKGYYDMFRERIIFPIIGTNGNVIAFGARAMDNALPKYINSPETSVFKKSETLYGFFTAKEAIREKEAVMIVEGYMDVIICNQFGFRNVVAPLGTALTAGHLQKLRKFTREAVVVFDGDQAGIAAAKRALPLFCQNNMKAKILLLPDKEDPDSYLNRHGSDAFSRLIEKADSMIGFIFRVSKGSKTETLRDALSLIVENRDSLDAEEMLMELAGKTRISEIALREEFKKIKAKSGNAPGQQVREKPFSGNREEKLLLSAVIAFPEKAGYVLSRISSEDISDKSASSLLKRIGSLKDKNDISKILDEADENEKLIYTRFSVDPGFDLEHVDRNIEDCLVKIEKRKFEEKLHNAHASGDLKLFQSLLNEKKKNIKVKAYERL